MQHTLTITTPTGEETITVDADHISYVTEVFYLDDTGLVHLRTNVELDPAIYKSPVQIEDRAADVFGYSNHTRGPGA